MITLINRSITRSILPIFVFIFYCSLPTILSGADYYWVGGSGNWSDLSHWATSSGGSVQHDQIPTASDDVYFDQNSFSAATNTIDLDLDIIFCQSLDFRDIDRSVQIRGPAETVLSIHGSLHMHVNVGLDFSGSFDFKSDQMGREVEWQGQTPHRLNFLGQGGWTITSNVAVDSLIRIEFGTVSLGAIQMQCQRFEVFSETQVHLDFGDADIHITGNRLREMPSYRWRESLHFEGGSINVDPGNSFIRLSGLQSSVGLYSLHEIHLGHIEIGIPGGEHLVYATWHGDFVIDRLFLRGNTRIKGAFDVRELELDGGNVYTYQSNFEQKVGLLKVNANCSALAFLKASEGGRAAIFMATRGQQSAAYLMLQDIHVQGATFEASEAIDLGGNQGWSIQVKAQETFYWIGDSGHWSDPAHWSFSSGGPPSGCLPTAADDVIFDGASFNAPNQMVTIDIPNAFCHSFDWRQVQTPCSFTNLSLPNKVSLHVFGSFWLADLTTNAFNGDVLFESPHGGNEILTEGAEFNLNVIFNSSLGEWTLQDILDVDDTIQFNAGTLHTNDQPIESFFLLSETNAERTLNLGNSVWRLVMTDDHPYYWSHIGFNANNLTINPGNSLFKCENSTSLQSWSDGTVDLHRIRFEGFGSLTNDRNGATELNIRKASFLTDGDFRNEMNIDTLLLSPTWKYTMYMNSVIHIDSLSARGNCDGSIYFAATPRGVQGKLVKTSGTVLTSDLILEGIIGEGGADFIAQSSIDLGNNDGWQFTSKNKRTLYWIGSNGFWHDRMNWSLSSGGPGGACIPTAIDDVIFDQNSFTDMWQGVGLMGSRSPICHDMTWHDVPGFVYINDGELYLTGSLSLEPDINFHPWTLYFSSDSLNNKIKSGGNTISWVQIMGHGSWTLEDDFNVSTNLTFKSGSLRTNSQTMTLGHLSMDNYPIDFARELILDNSHIIFSPMPLWEEQLFINSNNFTIEPGKSLVQFQGDAGRSRHYGSDTLHLHNVLFSSPSGTSTIEQWDQSHFTYNKLQINNNGVIYGSNFMDSLLLAPGKEYELEMEKTQTVGSYLLAIGNNCTPISLRSTEPGTQSTVFSESARVVADFIQLQDQLATGGADFTAGSHSTDISNNDGWIFEPAPDHIEVGFLGADRTLCQDSSITLSAYNFSPNETYLWNDVSTDSTLNVSNTGTYWARVTFKNNCVISDTIQVRDPLSLQVTLGQDTTLCEGESLILDGDIAFPEAIYAWQDGSTDSQLSVDSTGRYTLNVEVEGCSFSDSIDVDFQTLPEANIVGASSVCEGDTLLLDATVSGASYQWQNSSTQPTLEATADGVYWVLVTVDQCSARDSIDIAFTPKPPLHLGVDTALCQGEQWTIDVTVDQAVYQWSDGSVEAAFSADSSGLYWVNLTRANCSVSDSVQVTFNPRPILPTLNDTSLCLGTEWGISLEEANVTYDWSHGVQGGNIQIGQPGEYHVRALLDDCEQRDSLTIHFENPPLLDLANDISICQGEALDLISPEPSVEYIWQDSIPHAAFSIQASGLYHVSAQKLNCAVTDSIQVILHPLPYFSLGPDMHLCPGDSFLLAPDQTSGEFLWQNGASNPNLTAQTPGIYWLERTVNNCLFRDSVIITNSEIIDINLGVDTIICDDKTILLNAFHPQAETYAWQDGNASAERIIESPGRYSVELDDGRCQFTFEREIQFRECHYFSVFMPNVFSPNGDGLNDLYQPLVAPNIQIESFLFQIYNRWGNLIFSTTDPNEGWDGNFGGTPTDIDTYLAYVSISYLDDEGQGRFENGESIHLIR